MCVENATRTVVPALVHPKVAVAVRRDDSGFLIFVNPTLVGSERAAAEASAHRTIDRLESGWAYTAPEGGVDVLPFAA